MKKRLSILAISLLPLTVLSTAAAEDLAEIYKMAMESDPILQTEQAAYEATTHGQRQAKALYLPNINFSASYTDTTQDITSSTSSFVSTGSQNYTSKSYSLSLRQALYRRDYMTQFKQAKADTRQAEAKLNSAQQALIIRVTEGYSNALAAQDNLEFTRAEKSAIERQLEQAKQRFEVGLIAITDVHEAQAAYDLATAGEIVARNQLEVSHLALREITGQLPQSLQPLKETLPLTSPDPTDISQWVDSALEQSFDVIAAEAAVEAAQQALKQRRAGRHPTLDLVASRTHNNSDGGTFGGQETENTALSLQLNVPLYLGGSLGAGIQQGRAQLTRAKLALEQQRRATQRQVSDAYLGVQASISRVKALDQAVISSESAFKATEAGYEVGSRTTVDVLNSQRELFRTQRDASRARYDYILASLRLQQAAGILDADDLLQINAWLN